MKDVELLYQLIYLIVLAMKTKDAKQKESHKKEIEKLLEGI